MIQESYYIVKIEKVTKGIKEQRSWEKLYDEKHPKILANPETCQYGYLDVIKPFTDTDKVFEQRVESVDVARVLKAINREL